MPNTIPGPAYRIETARLVIRCYNPADAPLLKAAVDASLEHLKPWMIWAQRGPHPLEHYVERLRSWRGQFDLNQDYVYGVFSRDERIVIGGTGLHTRAGPGAREIGYWVRQDHINQGIATEASAALTKVAFEIDGVHRVEINCDPRNERSAAVPRKLGFTHEATLREQLEQPDGTFRDLMIWTLLKPEYPSSPAAKIAIEAYDAMGRKITLGEGLQEDEE